METIGAHRRGLAQAMGRQTSGMNIGDLVGNPPAHEPLRPSWKCAADGADWPCVEAREHMLTAWTPVPRALTMATYFTQACEDLSTAPAGEIHRRFLGWIRST
jgi:hypothetical protein